jgi:outer membrane immunogenic protein
MKKIALSIVAGLIATPAFAADMAVRSPQTAPPVPVFSWTGCYLGGNLGLGWASFRYSNPSDSPLSGDRGSTTPNNIVGGAQVGCDYQTAAQWVVGVQGMFDWTDLSGDFVDAFNPNFAESAQAKWFTTLTGRIGYAVSPSALLYVKGGAAWVGDHHADTITATGVVDATADLTRTGWTVGVGGEYMFAPNWSAFVEFDYLGFGTQTVGFAPGIPGPFSFQINQHIQTIEVGLNYRFNWAGHGY